MALQATLNGDPYTVAASGTEHHVILDGNLYSVVNSALDASLAASAGPVFLSREASITADGTNGEKVLLPSGYAFDVPREWRALYFKTASGTRLLSILPVRGKAVE